MSPKPECPPGDSAGWQLAAIGLILATCLGLFSQPVPASNEWIYLLGPYRQWHPEFLSKDWTFGYPWWEHLPFNLLAGLPMLILPLEWVAWAGRLASWVLVTLGLIRLGRHLGLPPLASAVAIVCWLLYGQSLYGGEWMVETFEAKPFGYGALLFGLDALLRGRSVRAGVMLGLAFTLHPSVGLVGGFGAVTAAIFLRQPRVALRKLITWAALLALPGLLLLLPVLIGGAGNPRSEWEYLATVRMPSILDPLAPGRRYVAVSFLMLGAMALYSLANPADRAARFMAWFNSALALVCAGGIAVFLLGWYEWLRIFPFRHFPVFSLLTFFMIALSSLWNSKRAGARVATLAVVALCLVPLGTKPVHAISAIRNRGEMWHDDPQLQSVWLWLRNNTDSSSIVLAPPWRPDGLYHGHRAQIVNWQGVRYDALSEWRSRFEELAGPQHTTTIENLERGYSEMTESKVIELAVRYQASYLVAWRPYGFPVAYRVGRYRVYSLTEATPE